MENHPAGSRLISATEQRYAPIEGEALAVAWGLEQTKYFTQGCDNSLVVTDHKPLTKIFGDRTLNEISNTRLFRLQQRTLLCILILCIYLINLIALLTPRHDTLHNRILRRVSMYPIRLSLLKRLLYLLFSRNSLKNYVYNGMKLPNTQLATHR